jgi:mannosyltransferase OCH1-like enzyme
MLIKTLFLNKSISAPVPVPVPIKNKIIKKKQIYNYEEKKIITTFDENIILEYENLKKSIEAELLKISTDMKELNSISISDIDMITKMKQKLELDTKILNNNIIEIDKKIENQKIINNNLREQNERKIKEENEKILLKQQIEENKKKEEQKNSEKELILQELKKKSIIPLKIFQTWHTSNLPKQMRESVNKIKKINPEFEYIFHDDNQCREFIANHFPDMVLYAFDNLIPGSYKADIWRYCVLYIYGGIYIDIKFEPINDFKLINLVDKEYYVLDRYLDTIDYDFNKIGIYNGLMVMKPNNEILKKALSQIIKNVINKNYCISPIHITGAGLLGSLIHKEDEEYGDVYKNYKLKFSKCGNFIIDEESNNILKIYAGYKDEQNRFQKTLHYNNLWNSKKIYLVKNMNNCVLINAVDF